MITVTWSKTKDTNPNSFSPFFRYAAQRYTSTTLASSGSGGTSCLIPSHVARWIHLVGFLLFQIIPFQQSCTVWHSPMWACPAWRKEHTNWLSYDRENWRLWGRSYRGFNSWRRAESIYPNWKVNFPWLTVGNNSTIISYTEVHHYNYISLFERSVTIASRHHQLIIARHSYFFQTLSISLFEILFNCAVEVLSRCTSQLLYNNVLQNEQFGVW